MNERKEAEIGLDKEQLDEIRAYMAKGEVAAALAVINACSTNELVGMSEDIGEALRKPPGAQQWACVRRPDILASLVGMIGGPDLLLQAAEAAVSWGIPKEHDPDPDLYAFTREFYPFLLEMFDGRKPRNGWDEYERSMKTKATSWMEKAKNVKAADAEGQALLKLGHVAIAGRYAVMGSSWSAYQDHQRSGCEDGDCPMDAIWGNVLRDQALGVIQGCHMQRQAALAQREDFSKQSLETIYKERWKLIAECSGVMRRAVPFELLQAYANGTVQSAIPSVEIN